MRSRHSPTGSPLGLTFMMLDALELGHLEAEVLAHAADLAVEPCTRVMQKHEGASRFTLHFLVTVPRMGTPAAMPRTNSSVTGLVHGHQVLFLVIVARPQDLVHQIPVVGEEDEPLGVLVRGALWGRCGCCG